MSRVTQDGFKIGDLVQGKLGSKVAGRTGVIIEITPQGPVGNIIIQWDDSSPPEWAWPTELERQFNEVVR